MKARHKAGMALPAAVLRGIAIQSQPHDLARPTRPSIPAPVSTSVQADWKTLREQAFAEGRQQGYETGRSDAQAETLAESRREMDAARAAGLKEGREAASAELEHARKTLLEQAAAQMKSRAERLERLLSSIESQAARALWDAEDDVVALANDAICKLLATEAVAPETIRAGVKSLLTQHGQRTRLSVHVHPDDIVALQETAAGGDPWQWVADRSVQLGGVILRSPDGSLDARLETQLAALKAALLTARAERRAHYDAASLPGGSS